MSNQPGIISPDSPKKESNHGRMRGRGRWQGRNRGFQPRDRWFQPRDRGFQPREHLGRGGQSGRVEKFWEEVSKAFNVLRYFPEGIRNCYNLKVTSGTKYLIKAQFLYGNYDGLNDGPEFDLYLGPNKWTKVDLSFSSKTEEIIHIPN
ncbi:hypothetical protein F2Q69_00016886 [Brassica cretica]|uniref:Malectin-like domain-containing protein n=1 Tax=Brassica cretica TaxID=69181 RepID=A0A8S9QNK7_BRACR|nr:hypothetical protein F2Q69_00016886 [Brassica cretica]